MFWRIVFNLLHQCILICIVLYSDFAFYVISTMWCAFFISNKYYMHTLYNYDCCVHVINVRPITAGPLQRTYNMPSSMVVLHIDRLPSACDSRREGWQRSAIWPFAKLLWTRYHSSNPLVQLCNQLFLHIREKCEVYIEISVSVCRLVCLHILTSRPIC